jgi:RNA-directed DNA polymerase
VVAVTQQEAARQWLRGALARLSKFSALDPTRSMRSLKNLVTDPRTLAVAARHVSHGGATPGLDGLVPSEIGEDQWRILEDELARDLRVRRYEPSPLRPSRAGQARPILIPTIRDRVVQVATAWILGAVLEPRFSARSFAYRRGRGPHGAAYETLTQLRKLGATGTVLRIDIKKAFLAVRHRRLLGELRRHVRDEKVEHLVRDWIRAPIGERGHEQQLGLPMGAPISPAMFNLYLAPLDLLLEAAGVEFCRYADDIVIFLPGGIVEAEKLLKVVSTFAGGELGLTINREKSSMGPAAEPFEFVGFRFASGPDGPGMRANDRAFARLRRDLALIGAPGEP